MFESRLRLENEKGLLLFEGLTDLSHPSWTLPMLVMGLSPDLDSLKGLVVWFFSGLEQ